MYVFVKRELRYNVERYSEFSKDGKWNIVHSLSLYMIAYAAVDRSKVNLALFYIPESDLSKGRISCDVISILSNETFYYDICIYKAISEESLLESIKLTY